jgi:hypothetical protein
MDVELCDDGKKSWSLPPKKWQIFLYWKNHPFWMKVGWLVSSTNSEVGDDGWTSSMKN